MPRSPAVFHEHAPVVPDHGFLNSPFWWVVAGGSGMIGGISFVLGWRRKRRAELPADECPALHALA